MCTVFAGTRTISPAAAFSLAIGSGTGIRVPDLVSVSISFSKLGTHR